MRPRVIATLLFDGRRAVKTRRFKSPRYIGDPINIVRIFNDKGVDEILVIDISRSEHATVDFEFVEEIASEAFMPVGYGGLIATYDDAARLYSLGVEKCLFGRAIRDRPSLVSSVAKHYGSQAVCAVVDYAEKRLFRPASVVLDGRRTGENVREWAVSAESIGVGEIVLTSVLREGTRTGYDLATISTVSAAVDVPVVANGGAGATADFGAAVRAGASAVAAGSMFSFYGVHNAVLINYPDESTIQSTFPEE